MSAIISSPDKKYVFLGIQDGTLFKQINVHNHAVYDYGKLPEGQTYAIAVTFDNKFVFFGNGKQLFQYRLHDQQQIAEKTCETDISTIVTSCSDTKLWVGCEDGQLYNYSLDPLTEIKCHRNIKGGHITGLAMDTDNNFLWISGMDSCLKKFSIADDKIVFTLQVGFFFDDTRRIQITQDGTSMFVYKEYTDLVLVDLSNGAVIKDFGRQGEMTYGFQRLLLTGDEKYLFTSTEAGFFRQSSVRHGCKLTDFSKELQGYKIKPICD